MAKGLNPTQRELARWWTKRPEILRLLEEPSLRLDKTIRRLDADEVDEDRDLCEIIEGYRIKPEDLLVYAAEAEGPFRPRYTLVAAFIRPPDKVDPSVLCLSGPRGKSASPHRNGDIELCLYYANDPPERRWTLEHGLSALFDLARQHVLCEYLWREKESWPAEEAPHGRCSPAEPDASLAKTPQKKPGRNDPCPCGSGLKAKRCHFR